MFLDFFVNFLQVISSIPVVKACAVASCDDHTKVWGDNYNKLLLFAVLSPHGSNNCDILLNQLHCEMRRLLPTHCIPDSVIVMETLPMTVHGEKCT